MNTKIERKFDCFLMKTFCVETNYKNLYGWGVWTVIAGVARTGRNPQTGKALKIAASKVTKFTAGKDLKEAVNHKK